MNSISEIKKYLEANRARFITEWSEFLAIPSISTDPASQSECVRCATWLLTHLKKLGLTGELKFADTGYPIVIAKSSAAGSPSSRSVTVYGHYDVQPVDPLELWKSPPFSAELRNGRLYARGAQDNKGQLWYVVKALEYLNSTGQLGNTCVTLCIEGQEESGSEVLAAHLSELGKELKADTLLVCDTGTLSSKVATITMGLRGIAHCTVVVSGPNKDLHSGVHGGVARNPAQELARLLASLFDENGRVRVAGFYDGVVEPTAEEAALAAAGAPSETEYQSMIGAAPLGGERGYPLAVRGGLRPTIECNGIHSGYGGAGSKTIIPASAMAKLSMRLVKGQDGKRILESLRKHFEQHAVGVTVQVLDQVVGGPALQVSPNSESVRRVAPALKELMGVDPIYRWEGASIPIVSELARVTGAEPLMVGFGLEEDDIHAPNESFAIEQFDRGFIFACQALAVLGS